MSDENKTQNSNRNGFGAKGGFKGGRKFGSRDGKPGGKGNGRSGGFKGGKPAWKKDGDSKGGKPAWKKRDGEGKSESKDGKRFGDKPAWKRDGDKPAWKKDGEKRFERDNKRRDDRKGGKPAWKRDGDKPAWKKDADKDGKRFDRKEKRFDRKDGGRKGDNGDVKVDFKRKREYTKVDESSYEKPNFKNPGSKAGAKKDFRSDDRPREKRGDRYLRDNARLKSKKERDAMELSREDDFVYAGDRTMPKKALDGIFLEIGETVSHDSYGEGVVRKVTNGKVGVEFDGKYRWFAFPASIANGTLTQGSAQAKEPVEPEVEPEEEAVAQDEPMEMADALEALSEALSEEFDSVEDAE